MSSVDELCALGFEKYWVNQALELTNHNKDYALEWLLSDEFKLARQQFNEQKKKFKKKITPKDAAIPLSSPSDNKPNPLLINHSKDPSLQEVVSKNKEKQKQKENEIVDDDEEFEIEYNLNQPDLKPKKTLTDLFSHNKQKIGIDHLLDGTDSDDTDDVDDDNKQDNNFLLDPNMERIERSNSALIDHSPEPNPIQNDEDMQKFLSKLKSQVNMSGDWLCHSCGVTVSGDLKECHMCNAVRPGPTDWICDSCTFVNPEDVTVCTMCLSERPNANSLKPNANLSTESEHTWTCGSCGYHNTKTQMCRMCGLVLGDEVTPENDSKQSENKEDNNGGGVMSMIKNKMNINVNAKDNGSPLKEIMSPSKHVSCNSGNDVFGAMNGNGWDLPDAPNHDVKSKVSSSSSNKKQNGGGGGMVMLQRPKKKKEEEDEDEEDSIEESSVEEVVENVDDDNEENDIMAFEIPIMDEEQLKENEDVINVQKTMVIEEEQQKQKEQPKKQASKPPIAEKKKEEKVPELTGIELLKSMYNKDENKQKNTKIKLKLRVGTVVDIYSSSRQDWVEGIIKEIKGDLICIVYGKHMKWLKKNSRQLRPKAESVKAALQQNELKQQQQKEEENENMLWAGQNNQKEEVAPAAFADQEFKPPPPSGPPPAFAMEEANDVNNNLLKPIEEENNNQNNGMMASAADEFDYDVTFTTSVLGLELYPGKDGKNCIVGKCLSKTSKKFVDPSSMIVSVNDMWVQGMSYDMVRDSIKQAAKYPPLKIQFRVKMKDIGKKKNAGINERGYLKVKVVAGVQLKHRASYCVVQVGNARLSTQEVQRDEHPEWQEMLTFKNFRPAEGKKAVVTVFDHSTILKDKKCGTTEYKLPTQFGKLQRDTLELKSSKGKLSGVIILNTIIVHKSNSIRHLRKY